MITDDELDEIRARADAATPGPWRWRHCGEIVSGRHVVATSDAGGGAVWVEWRTESDLKFAAHARADIPRLIAEIRRLRGEWRKLVEALHEADANIPLDSEPGDITNYLAVAVADSRQHTTCSARCLLCGEQVADQTCPGCHGYGKIPGDVRIECETCGGDGRVHDCPEVSYAELVRVYRETRQEGA